MATTMFRPSRPPLQLPRSLDPTKSPQSRPRSFANGTDKQSIDLPTQEAIRANQVWCATLPDFDEVIICVERSQRIEHFSNKARDQVQGIRSAEPSTVVERKLLDDTIKDLQSDARMAGRYLRIGTGTRTQRLSDYDY
jgi:hypothetical protein